MELLCCEGEQLKRAFLDPVFFSDNRVLHNLLNVEDHYAVSSKYMEFQTDIKPYMRKVVTNWMLEVRMMCRLIPVTRILGLMQVGLLKVTPWSNHLLCPIGRLSYRKSA